MLDKQDLQAIREMMTEEIGKAVSASEERMIRRMTDSEERMIRHMDLLMENEVRPNFRLLAEGHETLLQTLSPKSRVDELAEEVSFLKTVVSSLSKEVNELKKAI